MQGAGNGTLYFCFSAIFCLPDKKMLRKPEKLVIMEKKPHTAGMEWALRKDMVSGMISSQTIQTSIDELKAITKVDLCVYDLSGTLVASTTAQIEIASDLISGFANSPADSQVIGIHHLLKIMDEGELLYILVAKGLSEDVYMIGKIAVSQLQNLIIAYKERFDRNNFFQNLLLDNMLLWDK